MITIRLKIFHKKISGEQHFRVCGPYRVGRGQLSRNISDRAGGCNEDLRGSLPGVDKPVRPGKNPGRAVKATVSFLVCFFSLQR